MNIEEEKIFNEFLLEKERQHECVRNQPSNSAYGFMWEWEGKYEINNPVIIKYKKAVFAKVKFRGEIIFVDARSYFGKYSNNQELIGEYKIEKNASVCGVTYSLIPPDHTDL